MFSTHACGMTEQSLERDRTAFAGAGGALPADVGASADATLVHESGLEVEVRQTNHEGELLDWLNAAADDGTPVVLNAAAWTHYSWAIFDACAQLTAPLVEVHISDPAQRPEEFRHTSVVTPHAVSVVAGKGIDGYREALEIVAGS